jgi:choline transport protein
VSEFSPPRFQKLLSYLSGWLTAIGWQMYLASVNFLVGTIIQGLIALNTPSYIYERWHGTLLSIAIVFFCIPFVTFLAGKLPWIEGGLLCLHIVGFFAIIGTMWGTSEPSNAREVLLNFYDGGGWGNEGISAMVGLIAPLAVLVGYDCSVHMSEETRDASATLPKAIMGSVLLNVTLVFIMVVTICFCLGDPAAALDTVTGYPFIQMFYNSTGSLAATNVLTVIPMVMLAGCAFSEVAASSRQLWAL